MPLQSYTTVDPVTGKPQLELEEQISFTAEQTKLVFGSKDKEEGVGTLFITNKHVIWFSSPSSATSPPAIGYRLDYPYILMHAVCRDVSSFPQPCLYAQLDEEAEEETPYQGSSMRQQMNVDESGEHKDDEEAEDEEDESPSTISELRFVPENPDLLDSLWNAMSACAALNPDAEEPSDGEGEFMFNADEIRNGVPTEMEQDYGEGGENAADYDGNEARMQGLQMSMGGMTAEEMYGDEDEEGGEEEEEVEIPTESSARRPKQSHPDDATTVAAQISTATAQVMEAPNASNTPGKKREREEDETQATEPAKK